MWQKCPVCNGTGAIPGGQVSSSLFTSCPTCDGKRIISELTGFPPSFVSEKKKNEQDLSLVKLTETPKVYTTGLQLENTPTFGEWYSWAVCEVTSKNGNIYQCGEDAVSTPQGSWLGVTTGMHAKFYHIRNIEPPEDFTLTKIMRYQ